MTDRLKIVRSHARNVHYVHGHKHLDDDASRVSISMRWGAVLLKHKKLVLGQCACFAMASKQESRHDSTVCSLHFDTKSVQYDCNKSSVW